MICLTHIIPTSIKKRDEALTIKKQIENFGFMMVVLSKILQIVNIPSKVMQFKAID